MIEAPKAKTMAFATEVRRALDEVAQKKDLRAELLHKLQQAQKSLEVENRALSELHREDERRLRELAEHGQFPDDHNTDTKKLHQQSRRVRTAAYAVELCQQKIAAADSDIASAKNQLVTAWEEFGILQLRAVRAQMREAAVRYKELYAIQMAWLFVHPFADHRLQYGAGTIIDPQTGEEIPRRITFAVESFIADPETMKPVVDRLLMSPGGWKPIAGDLHDQLGALSEEVRKAAEA